MNSKTDIIQTISSLEELEGYEVEAKRRGITGDELRAIFEMKDRLKPKKKGNRK